MRNESQKIGKGVYSAPLTPTFSLLTTQSGIAAYSVEYTIQLQLGSPLQSVPCILDSGSPWAVIYSSACNSSDCQDHILFEYQNSSTWTSITPLNVSYGAGTIIGEEGMDLIEFPGTLTAISSRLVLAEDVDWGLEGFNGMNFSGIFGVSMAPGIYANLSYVQTAYDAGLIENNVVGFSGGIYQQGEVVLGGYNENAFTGPISWHNVTAGGYGILFTLLGSAMEVNGVRTDANVFILVDTGGGFFFVEGPAIPSLEVNSDCSNIKDLPSITFWLDDTPITMDPQDYVIKNSTSCVTSGASANATEIYVQFSGTFYARYYTIFDRENQRVGFAQNANYPF